MRTGFYVALVGSALVLGACGDNQERCGAGTTSVDGECVPDGTVTCGQGTVLVDGECVIDPDACPEGTVFVDGACIPEDDALTADLEEAAEPNDGQLQDDGIAGQLDVPAVGEDGVVLHGCVTPYRDADSNGNTDIDFDAWILHADGPGVVEITADGVHGLTAGYAVLPTTQDPLLAGTWRRFGINLAGDTSQRQLFLPMAGDYVLFMSDSRSLFLQDGATGNEETCYYTTVKSVEAPTPLPLTAAAPGQAMHDGAPVIYQYDPTECDIIELNHTVGGAAILGSYVTLIDGDVHNVSAGFTRIGGLENANVVQVVDDPEYDYALEPQAMTLSLYRYTTTVLPTDGSTITVTNADDAFSFQNTTWACVDVPANSVSRFDFTFSDPAHFGFLTGDFGVVSVPADTNVPAVTDYGDFIFFPGAGRYYVALIELDDGGGTFDVTSSFSSAVPSALGVPGTVDNGPFNDYGATWHRFSGGTSTWAAFNASASGFDGDVGIDLYDTQLAVGIPDFDFPAAQSIDLTNDGSSIGGRVTADDTHTYFVRVTDRDPNSTAGAGATYDLAVTNRNYDNLGTLTEIAPGTRTGVTATAGEPVLYFARASAGDNMTITATPTGADVAIVTLDRTENLVDFADDEGDDGAETLSQSVSGSATWVAFAIFPFSSGTFDLEVTVVSPIPYTSTTGSIAYTDVCADANALDLMQYAPFGGDEALTPPLTLSFPFALFGQTTSGDYQVSTNGWIAFGNSGGSANFNNVSIPNVVPPNGIVAPFWDDFVVNTWCVLDNGTDTATFEWVGYHYDSLQTMQVQAILHADGVIDYVYGPNQQATGEAIGPEFGGPGATVGVESIDGSFGNQYVLNQPLVAPNTSRVLTPTP